ncbi:hypothetical protein AgCh_007894 [Apium graveolens]
MSGGGVGMSGERGVERVREESGVVREMSREIERDEVGENEKSGGEREGSTSEMRVESERVEWWFGDGGEEDVSGERWELKRYQRFSECLQTSSTGAVK